MLTDPGVGAQGKGTRCLWGRLAGQGGLGPTHHTDGRSVCRWSGHGAGLGAPPPALGQAPLQAMLWAGRDWLNLEEPSPQSGWGEAHPGVGSQWGPWTAGGVARQGKFPRKSLPSSALLPALASSFLSHLSALRGWGKAIRNSGHNQEGPRWPLQALALVVVGCQHPSKDSRTHRGGRRARRCRRESRGGLGGQRDSPGPGWVLRAGVSGCVALDGMLSGSRAASTDLTWKEGEAQSRWARDGQHAALEAGGAVAPGHARAASLLCLGPGTGMT